MSELKCAINAISINNGSAIKASMLATLPMIKRDPKQAEWLFFHVLQYPSIIKMLLDAGVEPSDRIIKYSITYGYVKTAEIFNNHNKDRFGAVWATLNRATRFRFLRRKNELRVSD